MLFFCYTLPYMPEPHIALYRKYRPQTFDDVVGQGDIVALLTQAIKQKKISHAYLFCGGRGTGKTTVARIFAHDIGCHDEDVIEIDAASNRGIDEIRELRDAVRTAPFSSPYKVYIVDEAHMLTKEAANALLKTLEEPPSHVVFILATTDPQKLPETIVSRCQKLTFVSPTLQVLSERLMYVAQKEGKEIDEATAQLVATHGNGSYRDALGVLEQVITASPKKISYASVLAFFGVTKEETVLALVTAVCQRETTLLVRTISELEASTVAPLRAYDDVTEMFRVALLVRIGETSPSSSFTKTTLATLQTLAKERPYSVSSKTILTLLSHRHLLSVHAMSAWAAFQAVMIGLTEEEKEIGGGNR